MTDDEYRKYMETLGEDMADSPIEWPSVIDPKITPSRTCEGLVDRKGQCSQEIRKPSLLDYPDLPNISISKTFLRRLKPNQVDQTVAERVAKIFARAEQHMLDRS